MRKSLQFKKNEKLDKKGTVSKMYMISKISIYSLVDKCDSSGSLDVGSIPDSVISFFTDIYVQVRYHHFSTDEKKIRIKKNFFFVSNRAVPVITGPWYDKEPAKKMVQ